MDKNRDQMEYTYNEDELYVGRTSNGPVSVVALQMDSQYRHENDLNAWNEYWICEESDDIFFRRRPLVWCRYKLCSVKNMNQNSKATE